ncbi:hypothetical protein FHX82_007267 [Amycolatopsis bartoniae]|uniref:Transposase n=1 Tax=Amycolatopsis bartoniae TaxID=941986 RepID=A0A8H9IQG5_9PSEU|nr:hypothetical protein [Amycolatopsis bartoniae]GHF37100.1 hypothetical protein GCM10017566_07810 [Amycolatopsis bartoniae]
MPKRYPPEVREKAVRLALDRLDDYGFAYAAAHAVGPMVDVHPRHCACGSSRPSNRTPRAWRRRPVVSWP